MLAKLLRTAMIATLPRWQRELGDVCQPRVLDALIRPRHARGFAVAGNESRR